MSQSGYTPIQLYRTTTAAATPSAGNLAAGELAINLTDEKLYFKNAAGTVKLLASTDTLGTVTSVAVSGGTTGLTTSGGPITTSGTITLAGTLGVANGGTGTTTAFTAGSVVFAGASGVYSQDNANLFWDNANDRLGIGTASPAYKLDVSGTFRTTGIAYLGDATTTLIASIGNSASSGVKIIQFQRASGTGDNVNIQGISTGVGAADLGIQAQGGNVGIGTSSPTTKLQVAGITRINDATNSTAVTIDASTTGGLTSIITQFGGSQLALGSAGAERMRIDGSGNVGIGTNAPSSFGVLAVVKNQTADTAITVGNGGTGSATTTMSFALAETGTAQGWFRRYRDGSGNTEVGFSDALLFTGNVASTKAERMRIDSSGRVGIGTSTPGSYPYGGLLNVAGSISMSLGERLGWGISDAFTLNGVTTAQYGFTYGGGSNLVTASGYYGLNFATLGSERMRLDSSGNVGIGTTAPQAPFGGRALQVGTTTDARAVFTLQSTTSGRGSVYFSDGTSGGDTFAGYLDYDHSVNNMLFGTGATERMRIDSSGNLLVGKTAANDTTLGAELQGVGTVVSTRSGSTNAQSTMIVYSTGAAAYRFFVGMDGTINATSTSIAAISDIRLKENVRDLDAGLNTILALKPRRFDWKEGKGKDVKDDMGFIAQEVETVLPALIGGWKAGEGEPDDLKSVKAGDLIPVLVKAIQELTARVAQLEGN